MGSLIMDLGHESGQHKEQWGLLSANLGLGSNLSPKQSHHGQAQNQKPTYVSPKPISITKLGLMPQLKPKPKLHLLHSLPLPAPGFSTFATSPRRQRRRHHVGITVREWQPTRIAFLARPRTPSPLPPPPPPPSLR